MSSDPVNSFNEVYTAFYRKSYLYVKSYIHDDMAAEDIVTDSLIKLWERMRKEPVDPVRPFLFTILKNRSLDYLKHQATKRDAFDAISKALNRELEIRTNTLEASDPNDIFSTEIQKIIEVTLRSLPERTREIFIMSRFENKSYKEIAEKFDISVKGVDYHIIHSVRHLRAALKDYLPLFGVFTFLN